MSFDELKGLDQAQVEERKAQGLVNKPSDAPFRSEKQIILSHLCTFFNLVFAVLALIPIWLYNGRRGPGGTKWQYFGYAFYPAHILVLALLMLAGVSL